MIKYVKLGEICKILNGFAFKSEKYMATGIRVVRITNVQKGYIEDADPEFYPLEEQKNIEKYMLYEGDLLISLTGNVGRVAVLQKELLPAALNQRVACLRISDAGRIYKPYLFHYLNSDYFEQQCIMSAKGVAQKNMSTEWLKEYEIPLPTIEKQREIAEIFSRIDELISGRKQQTTILEQTVKSRFIEMFGNMTHNTHGWDTLLLDECFEITSSKRILKSEWKDKGIPFLRVRDMVQLATTGKLDNEFFVSEEFYGSLSDSDGVPKQGDILMSATSTLGKCHVVSSGERFYFKDADVLRFRAKKAINPVFFMEQIKTEYIEEQIARTLGITTVAHFTIKAAKTINIRLPDIELQNQFAAFVGQVDKSKYIEKISVRVLTIFWQKVYI